MGTPVTRLCITHDDQFLLAADEASCLFVFDVRDRQDRGQAGSKLGGGELQPLAASEVMIENDLQYGRYASALFGLYIACVT